MRSVSTLVGFSWLVQRKGGADSIAQRQGIVEAFYDDSVTRQKLHVSHSCANRAKIQTTVLNRMPDFHRISKKFHRGTASLDDVVRVYQAVMIVRHP
jgi:DNA mismatch repair protein MSH2